MLIFNQEGPIATISINRPQVLNSLNQELILGLTDSIKEWSARPEIRILVLTGSGDKAFVGGVDVHALKDLDPEGAERFITDLHLCFLAIRQSEKIVIAAVNGYALGGGLELAASCDLRISSDQARFGMPEVQLGLPSVIEAVILPALIGLGRAAELLYTGEMIDAFEAQRIGLVNRVVPYEKLKEATWKMAERLLANGPGALVLQKRLINQWLDLNFSASIEAGIKTFRESFTTEEPKEGLKAFLEKRTPSYVKGQS